MFIIAFEHLRLPYWVTELSVERDQVCVRCRNEIHGLAAVGVSILCVVTSVWFWMDGLFGAGHALGFGVGTILSAAGFIAWYIVGRRVRVNLAAGEMSEVRYCRTLEFEVSDRYPYILVCPCESRISFGWSGTVAVLMLDESQCMVLGADDHQASLMEKLRQLPAVWKGRVVVDPQRRVVLRVTRLLESSAHYD